MSRNRSEQGSLPLLRPGVLRTALASWAKRRLNSEASTFKARRTVLTRNRVHAAVELERRARGGSEQASIRRIAEWVRHHHPNWTTNLPLLHVLHSTFLGHDVPLLHRYHLDPLGLSRLKKNAKEKQVSKAK